VPAPRRFRLGSSSMKPRARSRTSVSIGSNQLSKQSTAITVAGYCMESGFVVSLVMAWSPVRRFNAGRFEVDHPGDYANPNSYHPCDGTAARRAHSLAPIPARSRGS
jgi:hypothetical protein